MKSFLLYFFVILVGTFQTISAQVFSQECDIINAGEDIETNCGDDSAVTLSATFMTSAVTSDTSVYQITDVECPLADLTGEPTDLNIDDRWSNPIDLNFEFEFFGQTYSQVLIGANGLISFDIDLADTFCPWSFEPDELVPTPDLPTNGVLGAYHDIDPSEGGTIEYTTVGVAPQRQFKVSFVHIPHFDCNELLTTQQIILYESSNVIDVIVTEKPSCQDWNDGLAVIGIQNATGTVGYSPQGRNTGVWSVTFQELWRFIPDGEPNYVFEWLDELGNSIGNTQEITVNPTETSTYTAAVTYTSSSGETATVTDDVIVNLDSNAPNAGEPNDLRVCTTDESTIFDLTSQDLIIINGVTDATLSYFETENDAIAGSDPIVNPTMYEVSSPLQTIYFSLVSNSDSECSAIGSFTLFRDPAVTSVQPNNIEVCTTDTSTIFDLTIQDNTIIDGQSNVTVLYYEDENDAIASNNAISNPSTYESTFTPQTIYFVIASDENPDCSDSGSFVLIQNTTPIAGIPEDIRICTTDDSTIFDLTIQDTTIINGSMDATVSYYEDEADAIAGNNTITNPSMYESTTPSQTLYFSLVSDTNPECFVTGSFTLYRDTALISGQPDDLELCTTESSSVFDLTVQDATIINGESDATVTYHEDENDALSGINVIQNPATYESTFTPQTIYYRLQSDVNPDCFDTGDFDLIQNTTPTAAQPDDLTSCTTTGSSIFDLTVQNTIIIDGQTDVNITYHEIESDAIAGNNAIANPAMYESTSSLQTIYFRLESSTSPECFTNGSFVLLQTMTPISGEPDDLTSCTTTGSSIFDLTGQDTTVINGESDVNVTYYEVENDAIAGTNSIANPSAFESTLTPQTIYFRLEANANIDCFDIGSFDLIQNTTPSFVQPEDLTNCSNANGTAIFDLTTQNNTIVDSQLQVTVTYYETQTDADSSINEILNPTNYENFESPQTIYFRLENNTATECFTTGTFTLNVSTFDTSLVAFDQGCDGNDYVITISPINGSYDPNSVTYEWSGPIGASTVDNTSSSFVATEDGEYFVDITTAEGCVYTVSTMVNNAMCVFPGGISPNGDSMNDTFDLSAFNVLEIEIFNRQGRSVYKKTNYTNEWVGQSSSGELPVGTYFYVARLADNETRNGWIYIQR